MARRPSRRKPANRSTPSYRRVAVLIAVAIVTSATVNAQSVPTGVQEYYVLGWEQHIWDMMDRVQNAQGGAQFADGMNSVVTATASADNQVVYYDHWEDGPDGELANFPDVNPANLQASTVVIGDGITGNGDICNFNVNIACPSADVISAGDYVNFNSDRGLGGGCTTPGTPERCSVPLNPRDPDDIRFDGGDLIKTSGGPLTLIHSQYPLTNFIGGSIEILSRQAVEAARSYSVPIGEDLYVANTPTEPFHYVELELVAFENTSITVESPGVGSVSFALDRGDHWSSMGFINDVSSPGLGLTINSGTKVSTTAPISGLIFTGGDGTWATRLYTLLPDILHSTDYVTTAPGDVPNAGPTTNGTPQDRPANVYILNPDQVTSIDVDITDSSGTYTVTIPPNAMRSMDDIGAGRDIAPDSTVRMSSNRNFWGVTAYDYNTNISDWGHSWLAKKFLTSFYTVSFGPGNQNQPPDTSQYANEVFVAATADRTRVQFDLDNDGTYDQVDLDGDGGADAAPYPDNTYEVDMLSALRVIDPFDNDMTGARILANKPIAVSWGQDTDRSYYTDQALDTGFTVYPVNQLFLDPALTIDKEVDTTLVPTASVDPADRTVTYSLTVKSYRFGPLTDVEVWDLLPPGIYGDADYVEGSTLITCPDLTQGTADPTYDDCTTGGPPADQDCGRLTWDIEGACGAGFTLATDNTLKVRYDVVIPPAPGGLPRKLTNEGHAQAQLGGSVFSPFDTARVVQTDVTLTKAVDLTSPAAGDVVTFTLQVANTSTSVDETDVFISDPIPADTTFVPGSITDDGAFNGSGVFDASQNAVVWNAATFPWGDSATLSFQVRVNPTVPAGTEIPNRAGYESFETPYFLSNEVEPVVQGPLLQAVKTIVGNPGLAHPSETVTFAIQIDNNGTAAASNVFLSDPFPGNAAYVAGSMSWSLNSGPFAALSDANDGVEASGGDGRAFADRIEFRLANLGASQDVTLRFRVVVDPGTVGQFLANQAVFASDETPSIDTNLVQVPIVGDSQLTGHVFLDANNNQGQDPGEPNIPNVDVVVTDPTGAVQRVTTDASGDYTATVLIESSPIGCYLDRITAVAYNGSDDSLDWSPSPWTEYGNGADANTATDPMSVQPDPLVGASNNVLRIRGVIGSTATRGFSRQLDLDPGTTATLGFRYHRRGLEADDIITLEIDYGSGFSTLDTFGQPPGGAQNDATWLTASYSLDSVQLPANPVTLRWRSSSGYGYNTDQFYFDDVEVCVADVADADVTLDVDESDPDFPIGAVLTTANDPQTVSAVQGGTVASDDVGYRQSELLFTKTSNAVNNQVSPGQTVTYTMTVTNNTGATQTAITLNDPLPSDTSYVADSSQVQLPPQQVVERVSQDSDDAEENLGNGNMTLGSNDLDIVYANNTEQMVGVRFQGVAVPPGATVTGATIQFQADETDNATTNVVIVGQAADSAGTFTTANGNISSRAQTTATVAWTDIEPWATNGNYLTPDLTAIVQEIVDRPGWASGNNMAFMFSAGTGCTSSDCQRAAEPYDSEPANAALLTVDYSIVAAAGTPPDLLDGTEGFTLPAGGTMTVSFQVTVDDTLAGGITEIVNTATLYTASLGPYVASVTDAVVRAGVVIEYDNAGFGFDGDTVSYAHVVENTGEGDDSYDITVGSRLGWPTQLIDPGSGAVIAADADGNGAWDGNIEVNTGTLVPGGTIEYELRVAIPGGTGVGVADSTTLRATSDRNPGRFDVATDETMVVDFLEPVTVLPDNSGVAAAGGTAVYTHRVLNNTGGPATFDLTASREEGDPVWPTALYWDANSDGVYTQGVDIQITNTGQLAQGEWQTVFVVVNVLAGVSDFTTDVVHIKAALQTDPDVFGTATDTTTVRPPLVMDLSGGGTRWVEAGDAPEFPGVVRNFTGADDRMTFSITGSWFWGVDKLNHPVQLKIDTTGDGVPDTVIATDVDGDADDDGNGDWDVILPGYDTVIADGKPDVLVAAGGSLSYTLVRAVDLLQGPSRDPVTLTALSDNTGEQDSVTATLLLAAATDATLASFEAFSVAGRVVVEWRTAVEIGTLGFDLWRQRPGENGYTRVNPRLVRGLLGPMQGGTYRVVDEGARPGDTVSYILAETDTRGRGRNFGPFTVTPLEEPDFAKAATVPTQGATRTANTSRVRGHRRTVRDVKAAKVGVRSGLVKASVRESGLVWVSAEELAAAFDLPVATVSQHIAEADLWIDSEAVAAAAFDGIFSDGFETGDTTCWEEGCQEPNVEADGIAWIAASDNGGLYFYGEAIDSPYTRDNVYWVGVGSGRTMVWRSAEPVRLPAATTFGEELHFEEEFWPLTSVITDPEGDFWMWDYFFSNTPGYDVKAFSLEVPDVADSGGGARLALYLQGASVSEITPNHTIAVRLNDNQIGGTWSWNGDDPHVVLVDFPQAFLVSGDNTIEITALAAPGLDYDVFYLDAIELRYDRLYRARGDRLEATATATGTIAIEGFSTGDITVFNLDIPAAPVVLGGTEVEAGEDGFKIRFQAEAGTRFLATTSSAARPVAGLAADTASNLADPANHGRYVVIAGSGLEEEAAGFAALREGQGMSAVVAPVEDIYDEFSKGIVTPWAIRDFLRHASENWAEAPKYVFLLGDGSLDSTNRDGLGENLVPSLFTVTGDGLVPSDNSLADWLGDDGIPELAIGRLPAQSAAEAAAYRQKIAAFEASDGDWKRRTLWLADEPDMGGDFGDDTEGIIGAMPEDYAVERIYLDDLDLAAAWELTLEKMAAGALLVNFLGHGGLDRIADEGLLLTDDVAIMENGERTPFLTALTCIVGRFDIPDFDTFAEALLLKGDGGAIAVWSPAAYSLNENAKKLGAFHAAAIAEGDFHTVGDTVRAALDAYVTAGDGDPDLARIVVLLGDPAVRVDW